MVQTTVVGSYPRIGDTAAEQGLRRGIARFDRGEIRETELHGLERDVVRAVVREQTAAGIELVTDGQVAWHDSQSHVAGQLASVEVGGLVRYFDTNTYYRQPVVRGPVAWEGPILVDEWRFAQSESQAPVKAVLPGPVTLASLALDKHYRTRKALVFDLAESLGHEIEALVIAGARDVQIDEPILTRQPQDLSLVSEGLDRMRSRGGPASLTLFSYFGGVESILAELLDAPAGLLGLDLVQGASTWPALVKHGSTKPLVLGLIDARNTKEEDPAAVARKVRELEGRVDLKSSYLSPSNGLEFLPRDRARRKLRIVRAAADGVTAG